MQVVRPKSPYNMNYNSNQAEPEHAPDFLPTGIGKKQFNIINQGFNHKKLLMGKCTLNIFSDKKFS
jgi:hypothetical protein